MLSEEEKERIEALETHMFEIRSKLATKKARKFGFGMLVSFFNSKFGLWLLSAIFISGGVKVYDDYKEKQENEKTRGEIVEKLDNEIAFKLSGVLTALEAVKDNGFEMVLDKELSTLEAARIFTFGMNKPSESQEKYLYEEYKFWSLLALMVELERQQRYLNIHDAELIGAIKHLKKLSKFIENSQVNAEGLITMQQMIRDNLLLNRWKSNTLFEE